MMKITAIIAILACLAATASAACSYAQCMTNDEYPNCKPFCVPNVGCPANACGSLSDGCGGKIPCVCASTQFCGSAGQCCPNACTVTVTNKGKTVTLDGKCAQTQPENTVNGGPCPGSGCGTCWVDSFNPNLCSAGTSTNGSPCAGGKCGCYNTYSGASCQASNLNGLYNPLPSNGGGCEENFCNALAAKYGLSAGCCPTGCTSSGRKL